jgi:hypothetical protein
MEYHTKERSLITFQQPFEKLTFPAGVHLPSEDITLHPVNLDAVAWAFGRSLAMAFVFLHKSPGTTDFRETPLWSITETRKPCYVSFRYVNNDPTS